MTDFDLVVIGGGINGAAIARDAAGRGVRVLLAEQSDLASATSSASTGLIHGNLRGLQDRRLRLVRQSVAERELLLRLAPHLVRPLRLVLPHQGGLRSASARRFGFWLYNRLGTPWRAGGGRIDLTRGGIGVPLKQGFRLGFALFDCRADDSRLVVLNALDAAERGAVIRTHTRVVRADRDGLIWRLTLNVRGQRDVVTARVLINATGPWVANIMERVLRLKTRARLRLVKGSHILVPRLFEHDNGYMLERADGRIVYAIPQGPDFTLIGPTEQEFRGDPATAFASPEEITDLCRAASVFFRESVGPEQVVRTYAGVRVLYQDSSSMSQVTVHDYALARDAPYREAPLLTVYGGNLTTHRRLAEQALAAVAPYLVMAPAWTHTAPLPGGDFPSEGFDALVWRAWGRWPFLDPSHARRLVAAYGTRLDRVLGHARHPDDLQPRFGSELTPAEVRYMRRCEWAQSAEDVLWRRSKLGLRLTSDDVAALTRFLAEFPRENSSAAAE